MTATDILRRLLDERRVEYKTDDRQIVRYTDWGQWLFSEPLGAEPNTLGAQCELVCMPVTPEQAIDATLGRGTCHSANVTEYAWDDFECSECGWVTWNFVMEHEGCGTVQQPRYCPNCGRRVVE